MRQRWVSFAAVAVLGLSACVTAGKRGGDAPPAVYDLGAAPPTAAPAASPPLALEVRAVPWFDSQAMEYRLAYAEPGRLREYARARWAAPPALLVQQRLGRSLGLLTPGQGGAKCVIRLEIDEFSQIFDSPAASRGVLQARLALLDGGRRELAARDVGEAAPASSQDASGGAAALAAAVDRLGGVVASWRAELSAAGRLKGC